jgi:hypothetical protein
MKSAKNYAAAMAVLLALALCTATVFGGRIITGNVENDDFADGTYDDPISIRKKVEETSPRDYKLTLSAEGYDWKVQTPQDVYAVFVIDATSSMKQGDIPSGNGDGDQTRLLTAQEAVKAYLDAFFAEGSGGPNTGGRRHAAIVSYGHSARIHLDKKRADSIGVGANTAPSLTGGGKDYFIGRKATTAPSNEDLANGYYKSESKTEFDAAYV